MHQGIGHLFRGNALQIEPGDQVLDGLGLAEIGRKNPGGKAEAHGVFIHAAVIDAELLDLDGTQAAEDRANWLVAVADHQSMAGGVEPIAMGIVGQTGGLRTPHPRYAALIVASASTALGYSSQKKWGKTHPTVTKELTDRGMIVVPWGGLPQLVE